MYENWRNSETKKRFWDGSNAYAEPNLQFWAQRKNCRFPVPILRTGVLSLLRRPLLKIAKILLGGRYLWNGRSKSKIAENGLHFFWSEVNPLETQNVIFRPFLGISWNFGQIKAFGATPASSFQRWKFKKGVFWVSAHDANKNIGWCTKKRTFGHFWAYGSFGLPRGHLHNFVNTSKCLVGIHTWWQQKVAPMPPKRWIWGIFGQIWILGACTLSLQKGVFWVSTLLCNASLVWWILGAAFLVSCLFGGIHLWWAAYMMRRIYVVLHLWCGTNLLNYISIAIYLWCTASMVRCIFPAEVMFIWTIKQGRLDSGQQDKWL